MSYQYRGRYPRREQPQPIEAYKTILDHAKPITVELERDFKGRVRFRIKVKSRNLGEALEQIDNAYRELEQVYVRPSLGKEKEEVVESGVPEES